MFLGSDIMKITEVIKRDSSTINRSSIGLDECKLNVKSKTFNTISMNKIIVVYKK